MRKIVGVFIAALTAAAAATTLTPLKPSSAAPAATSTAGVAGLRPDNAALLYSDQAGAPGSVDGPSDGSMAANPDLELGDLEAAIAQAAGAEVGFSWITPELDGTDQLIMQVVVPDADSLARAQAAANSVFPGRVQVVPGSYTRKALIGYVAAASGAIPGVSTVGIAVRGDDRTPQGRPAIRVEIPAESLNDELLDILAAEVPRDVLEVKVSDMASAHMTSVNRDIFSPVRGGNRITGTTSTLGSSGQCSEGYVFVNAYGDFGSTAGHCYYHGRTGDYVYMASTNLDYIRSNTFVQSGNSNADIATYSLSANNRAFSKGVQITDTTVRQVTSRYNGGRAVGSSYCAVGDGYLSGIHHTDQECGLVTLNDVQINNATEGNNTTNLLHADCGDSDTYLGFSGGPVYLALADGTVKAAGTISTGGVGSACWIPINYTVFMLGSEIDYY